MAQTAATPIIPENFSALYEQLKQMLLPDAAKIDYQTRSRAELRAGVEDTLLPNLQAAMRERQYNTQRNNANIDADAAARGIGSSTWGTDVKNRNYSNEAKDIASMRGDYNSTLASNLNSLMSEQENRKLSADQYNRSEAANARSNALNIALNNYDTWGVSGAQASGSGSGGGSPTPLKSKYDNYLAELSAKNPYSYTTSYDAKAVAAQKQKAADVSKQVMLKRLGQNMSQLLAN